MLENKQCVLCCTQGGILIARGANWRVIRAEDQKGFPLTYRVIWNAHVAEFSDLLPLEREQCMAVVAWVEKAMRKFLSPDKINLAALGNMVPHLHWHIIARYKWDSHFPAPVWGQAVRDVDLSRWDALDAQREALEGYIKQGICEIQ